MANPTAPQVLAHLMGWEAGSQNWDRGQISPNLGSLHVAPGVTAVGVDGITNFVSQLRNQGNNGATNVAVLGHLYNGATQDRQRNNTDLVLLASAARTAATPTPDQINYNGRGVVLLLNVTANPGGAETLTVSIEAKIGGVYRTMTAFPATAAAANATYLYLLYPGIVETVAVANLEPQALVLPRGWRGVVTPSASGSWTYQLDGSLLL